MLLQIDFGSEEPIYRQIRTQIVHAVATGELSSGDSLPSVRALASDLGVNMHTVNKAYAVLRDEGYISMRGRSGAVIANVAQATAPARIEEDRQRIADQIRRLALEFMARGGTKEEFASLAKEQVEAAFASREDEA